MQKALKTEGNNTQLILFLLNLIILQRKEEQIHKPLVILVILEITSSLY